MKVTRRAAGKYCRKVRGCGCNCTDRCGSAGTSLLHQNRGVTHLPSLPSPPTTPRPSWGRLRRWLHERGGKNGSLSSLRVFTINCALCATGSRRTGSCVFSRQDDHYVHTMHLFHAHQWSQRFHAGVPDSLHVAQVFHTGEGLLFPVADNFFCGFGSDTG